MNYKLASLTQLRSFILNPMLIFLFTLGINLKYFDKNYYPVHDTLSVFEFFSYFYSEIFYNDTIPLWIPHTAFGMRSESYIFFTFGPFQYIAILIGKFLNLTNTLLLFNTSLLIESFFLATSLFYLLKKINNQSIIPLILTLISTFVIFYDRQIYWNFKILIPIPIALFFIHKFFEARRTENILLSFISLLIFSFGSVGYTLVVQFYVILIYFISLYLLKSKFKFRSNLLDPKFKFYFNRLRKVSLISSFILVALIINLIIFKLSIQKSFSYAGPGRNKDFNVEKSVFLNYGGNGEINKIFEFLIGIPYSHPHDFHNYVGISVLVFFFIGLFFIRKERIFIPSCCVILFLLLLTTPEIGIANYFYYLPGMSQVRHVAYFLPMVKLFIIIVASLGLKNFSQFKNVNFYFLILFVGILISFAYFQISNQPYAINFSILSVVTLTILFLAGTAHLKSLLSYKQFLFTFLIISLIDLGFYRHFLNEKADLFLAEFDSKFKSVRQIQYVGRDLTKTDQEASYFLKPLNSYGITSAFLNIDSCRQFRQDLISPSTYNLLKDYNLSITDLNDPESIKSSSLMTTLACGTSKFWISVGTNLSNSTRELKSPEVKNFDSNKLQLLFYNASKENTYLNYSDSNDPNWKVSINGQPATFDSQSYIKKVQVPFGPNKIDIFFERDLFYLFLIWNMILLPISIFYLVIRSLFR
jgi:hypothetical protein